MRSIATHGGSSVTRSGWPQRVGALLALVALLAAAFAPRVAHGQQGEARRGQSGQAAPAPAQRLTPTQFVIAALRGGRAEVAMASLALEWAGSPEVQELATRLIADRTWLNARLETIASTRDLRLPSQLADDHRLMLESLLTKRGAEFDRAYLEATTTAHQRDAPLYESAAAAGFPDAELRRFADESLPYLRAHLERAAALRQP